MNEIESKAFQQAALRSEIFRIHGLLILLAALLVYTIARFTVIGNVRLFVAQSVLIALAAGYELYMRWMVLRASKAGSFPSLGVWALNVIIEALIPTLAIFVLARSQIMSPFQALVAPAIFLYFVFIILSILRLVPLLSILTSAAAAVGYIAVALYVSSTTDSAADAAAFAPRVYLVYAFALLLSGGVAAFVAAQVRKHVEAALREAELQNKLDQVNHDLGVARSIQQGLLPAESPSIEDYEIAGWNQPADETGGDYFDWQALPDGRFAVSLGDATGHGIGPALISTSCRAYARASFLAGANGGGKLLGHLNRLLADDLDTNRFVTFAVVFLEPKTARIEVLSAGHGPILWYRQATGEIKNLEAQGIPLGMMAGIPYNHGNVGALGEGDILAMVTDGFYEWENPEGEDFGVPRIESVLNESRDLPAEEIIVRFRAAVADFCRGTRQMDDLTAVVLKRKASSISPTATVADP